MSTVKSNLQFVAGDTGPSTFMRLTDPETGDPVDLSDGVASAVLRVNKAGETTVIEVPAVKLIGHVLEDGSVTEAAPYNVAGRGGLIRFDYLGSYAEALEEAGDYEAEVRLTLANGSQQTIYPILTFPIREPLPGSQQ